MANQPMRDALYQQLRCDLAGYVPDLPESPDGVFPGISPSMSVQHVRALALAKSLVRKFQDETSPTARQTALDKFSDANHACGSWSYSPTSDWHDLLLGTFRECVYRFFTDRVPSFLSRRHDYFDWSFFLDWTKIAYFGDSGPGSCLKGSGTSWLEKFSSSDLTASRSFLFDLFDLHIRRNPLLASVEQNRAVAFKRILCPAAKLAFVPKSFSEHRIICIEPSLNVFFQKGVQVLLEDRLQAYYGIDLRVQPEINREMAFIGSLCGSFATIDLSSASDRISMKMLEWSVPKDYLSFFKVLRSPSVSIDGDEIDLNMISTMGNAFTFPLQTAIFAAAVEATYKCLGLPFKRGSMILRRGKDDVPLVECGTFSVFGDDIVCHQDAYDTLTELLDLLGFKVNDSKSFVTGDFRESCGHDYYSGYNVRGVYAKTLRTHQDAYSLINRLNRWTATSGIPLRGTVALIERFSGIQRIYVPPHEADEAGIHYPLELASKGVVKKWDKNFQADVIHYTAYKFIPVSLAVEKNVRGTFVKNRRWRFDDAGTLASACKGELRGGVLTSRGKGIYRLRTLSHSHGWECDREGVPLDERYYAAWKAACLANLTD